MMMVVSIAQGLMLTPRMTATRVATDDGTNGSTSKRSLKEVWHRRRQASMLKTLHGREEKHDDGGYLFS